MQAWALLPKPERMVTLLLEALEFVTDWQRGCSDGGSGLLQRCLLQSCLPAASMLPQQCMWCCPALVAEYRFARHAVRTQSKGLRDHVIGGLMEQVWAMERFGSMHTYTANRAMKHSRLCTAVIMHSIGRPPTERMLIELWGVRRRCKLNRRRGGMPPRQVGAIVTTMRRQAVGLADGLTGWLTASTTHIAEALLIYPALQKRQQ